MSALARILVWIGASSHCLRQYARAKSSTAQQRRLSMVGTFSGMRDGSTSILGQVLVRSEEKELNCVYWMEEALALVSADGRALGTKKTEWSDVRHTAMPFVKAEDAYRYDGNVQKGAFDQNKVATFDLLIRKETFP